MKKMMVVFALSLSVSSAFAGTPDQDPITGMSPID